MARSLDDRRGPDPADPAATLAARTDEVGSGWRRWGGSVGFGLGVMVGLIATVQTIARYSYDTLPIPLIYNLIWAPTLGLILGRRFGRIGRPQRWTWRSWQLRTHTLMLVVAYIGVLCGLGVATHRVGQSARQFNKKYVKSSQLVTAYRPLGEKLARDAIKQRDVSAQLRAGKNPTTLISGQREFLQSLDTNPQVTPEFRAERRGLILAGAERLGKNV